MSVRKQRYHARDGVRQRLYRSRNATRDVSSRCRDDDPIQYTTEQLGARLAVFQIPEFRLGNSVGVTRNPDKRDGFAHSRCTSSLTVFDPLLMSFSFAARGTLRIREKHVYCALATLLSQALILKLCFIKI